MSGFQGFDIKLNLIESTNDELAINNLAGAPIASDLIRFINNMRNESVIEVSSGNISGSTITIPNAKFVFTNGTIISVNGTERKVGDSNGVDTFRIYNSTTNALIPNPPEGLYVRSDAVTFEHLNRLSPKRERVIEVKSKSVFQLPSTVDPDTDPFTSLLKTYTLFGDSDLTSLGAGIQAVETGLDLVTLRKAKSIISGLDYETDTGVSLTGEILVKDPANKNATSYNDNRPGIFILNTATGKKKRIFSSSDNPWSKIGGNLVVNSSEIAANRIVFDDSVQINAKVGSDITTTVTATGITNFTHFAKIVVNGEEYQLCLTV